MVAGVARRIATRTAADWGGEQSRSLAALIDAGLAPLHAVEILRQQYPEYGWPLSLVTRRLKRGDSLVGALQGTPLYGPRALVLLQAAEEAGRVPDALRQIAMAAEQQQRRLATLKVQLSLPLSLLLLASLAGLGFRLYRSGQTLGTALAEAVLPLMLVLLATTLLLRLLRCDSGFWLSWGWRLGLARLPLYQRFYDHEFCRQLYWPLDAGMPQTLAPALGLLDVPDYRRRVSSAQRMLASGKGITDTLLHHNLVFGTMTRQLLAAAEHAGRLPEAIGHQLEQERAHLELGLDTFYQWLPRLYYLLVLSLGLGHLIK